MIQFAHERGWTVKDGQISFEKTKANDEDGGQNREMSKMVIENALGYARELETIV